MFLLKQDNNKIIKYRVDINKDRLLQLRTRIIDECSSIVFFSYDTNFPLNEINNSDYIKNFRSEFLKTEKTYYGEEYNRYRIHFEFYIHSVLISLIDSLLNNDSSAIDKIEKFNVRNNKITSNIINYGSIASDVFLIIEKYLLYGLKERDVKKILLENLDEGTFNHLTPDNYFAKEILSNVNLIKIDEMTIQEYQRYINFYELRQDDLLKPRINKSMRKLRNIPDF